MTIQTIIDAHVHFWHPDKVYIPWISGTKHKDAIEYREQVKKVGVFRAIYVETDVDPHHGLVEADWISEYASDLGEASCFGGIGGIVAYAPVHQGEHVKGYLRTLTRLVGPRLKGVRHLIQDPSSDPNRICHPDFIQGVQMLKEYNLSFDLTINCNECPLQFPPLQTLVSQCPLVRFILDHMGKPPCDSQPGDARFEFWKSQIIALAANENVYCKISGLVTELKKKENKASKETMIKQFKPFIDVVYTYFGSDRIMFGGDWPICESSATWQEWVEILTEITNPWPDEDKQKLFVTNALDIYKLNESQSLTINEYRTF
ncbi:hypothetical protein G6F37_007780 [Rhizopus arrhizus]|nr:hypothetical protein G6F38_000301 [Rhizopus arrhizus]KAG1156253.1 hypothetical protein G6F37_007780 [Rhizopus arrhizus]